jgi:hypothetical protein
MNDATLTFSANNATGTPTGYLVVWSQNGTALPPVTIPQTAAQDASGYTSDFTSATGVTPAPSDTLGATVQAIDSANSAINSVVVPSTPATVTVPAVTPQLSPPANVALALS